MKRSVFRAGTALLMGLALAACGGDDRPVSSDVPDAYRDVLAEAPRLRDASEFDTDAARALLPAGFDLSYETSEFDERTGRTRLTNVRLKPDAERALAFEADTLDLWGADLAAIEGRLAGEGLDGEQLILERLEAEGLSVSGLEVLYDPLMAPYNEAMSELAAEAGSLPEGPALEFEDYTLQAGRLVIDGFRLHPFKAPADDIWASLGEPDLRAVQLAAAYVRAHSIDAVVMEDIEMRLVARTYGETQEFDFAMDFVGYSGWSGGDLARSDTIGGTFSGRLPLMLPEEMGATDEDAVMAVTMLDFDGSIERSSAADLRLSGLLDAFIAGEMPATSETDLVSLGRYEIDALDYRLDGQPLYAIDRAVIDATAFHWLLPETLTADFDGYVYDLSAYAPIIKQSLPEEFAGETDVVDQAVEILQRHDLTGPASDIDFAWRWQPDDGPAELSFAQVTPGHNAVSLAVEGALPPYGEWAPLIRFGEDETPDEDALNAAFRNGLQLDGARLTLTDAGGLDKALAAITEIADILPQDNPQIAAFATYEPEALKSMAAGAIQLAAGQAARVFPPARAYAGALVAFINTGGTMEITLAPPEPINATSMEAFEAAHEDVPPADDIVAFLGLSVEHRGDE